jgi:hypothetical protein
VEHWDLPNTEICQSKDVASVMHLSSGTVEWQLHRKWNETALSMYHFIFFKANTEHYGVLIRGIHICNSAFSNLPVPGSLNNFQEKDRTIPMDGNL